MKKFDRLVELARAMHPKVHRPDEYFHVAFLLNKRKIVEIGTNSYEKTNPICSAYKAMRGNANLYRPNIHAEQAVLAKIKHYEPGDTEKFSMVLIRVSANGNIRNSCPCANCAFYLGKSHIGSVYYSDNDGNFNKFPR